MKNVIIFGATSEIAQSVAHILAARGDYSFFLVGRNERRLQAVADDLKVRGKVTVDCFTADFYQPSSLKEAFCKAEEKLGELHIVLAAQGILPDQQLCEESPEKVRDLMQINVLSISIILEEGSRYLSGCDHGVLAVITSVAGARGRAKNYYYGMSKSALSTILQGLRQRLSGTGINVLEIKPGWVDTPMTDSLDKGFLFASADRVAHDITRVLDKKNGILYTPWFWRYLMWAVKGLPGVIYNRLSF